MARKLVVAPVLVKQACNSQRYPGLARLLLFEFGESARVEANGERLAGS